MLATCVAPHLVGVGRGVLGNPLGEAARAAWVAYGWRLRQSASSRNPIAIDTPATHEMNDIAPTSANLPHSGVCCPRHWLGVVTGCPMVAVFVGEVVVVYCRFVFG